MSDKATSVRPGEFQPQSLTAAPQLDRFSYDDAIVRKFVFATILWGIVGMLVGVVIALQLVLPALPIDPKWLAWMDQPYLTFGRLRPLHTNAVIFAFAGNAIFAAVYYSTQRLCKARMWSDKLSAVHFWGWQAIIVSAAITLPLGITQSKEYAELEWPIDIAIAVVWLTFAWNFFATLKVRRERHLYVALWFYIATIVAITVLHVFNNLVVPASLWKSYSVYAGVQDAFMQWWYGHNAVAFFLTTPFLGLMYYFLPKAANRPVFSYRLSIIHFWSIVFIYIWAGPHHLHYTSLPAWASTLGMLFSLMLWMPSWGGMINGLLTLRGAWHKVAADPILKFYVVGITFYGMATFEGPMLSIKSVNALSHYTDWTIAHVHSGALGWVGFMVFGMIYWLLPRLFQAPMWSPRLMSTHFWIATIGILLYIIPIYWAGITQGLMWLGFDSKGMLAYPDFVETVTKLMPFYWVRVLGGSLYLAGACLCAANLYMTWRARPATYDEPIIEAPPLVPDFVDPPMSPSRLQSAQVTDFAKKLDVFNQMQWHRNWERLPLKFTIWTIIAVVSASLFEIVPTFAIKSNVVTIPTVRPYTPLELIGRDIYVAEGCYNCHSQMIRPLYAETERYGEYSLGGEFVYDRPFQWGSRRIGPDLHRVGGKLSHTWHIRHLIEPKSVVPGSIMPNYPHLMTEQLDFDAIPSRMRAMVTLGVPYSEEEIRAGADLARVQANRILQEIIEQDGADAAPQGLDRSKMVALVAYLQRLGIDRYATAEEVQE
ncbi:MAG TPA: cytochrome-c oxidase, cbb3-type subunit I [Phycisphaerales bacterium]|nr:cytochrome-c oxidase, cbb3-type subunit I [Phycisphaerales bacterium]HRQ74352.1 cytochrome-c oxidase, cbb3-type subunit I [Phycisphaerales bacterium]